MESSIVMELAKAEDLACILQQDEEDGWEYRVAPTPDGMKAIILVLDEEGELINVLQQAYLEGGKRPRYFSTPMSGKVAWII